MPDLATTLAGQTGCGCVVAPAGYGKTHLIAEAVSRSNTRQLVLTHTYAGVNALRRKLRDQRVSDKSYRVDTIASWSLRLCLSYAGASGWTSTRPIADQWQELYRVCTALLDYPFARRILRASYAGLYVDEYQDCSRDQHALILKIARDLPCRVLGDPLQAIFDFDDNNPVDWEREVLPAFELLGQLDTPHRWLRAGAHALGTWLDTARTTLEQRQPLDLTSGPRGGVKLKRASPDAAALFRAQGNCCRFLACAPEDTVIAIHAGHEQYKARCHALARNLAGRFSSIEEVEGKALFSFVSKIERARTDQRRFLALIVFAKQCMTNVEQNLSAATSRGDVTEMRGNTRNPDAAKAANACIAAWTSSSAGAFLKALKGVAAIDVVRADLFNRGLAVFQKHAMNPALTLTEAAEKYHAEFRYRGRPFGRRRLIGTTLLVKGLEFDHAIVLDAASLSRRELYVALTRGAKSLTIVSSTDTLTPHD